MKQTAGRAKRPADNELGGNLQTDARTRRHERLKAKPKGKVKK
jgi:hypothetical protein